MSKIRNKGLLGILMFVAISSGCSNNIKPYNYAPSANLKQSHGAAPTESKPNMSDLTQGLVALMAFYGLSQIPNGTQLATVYSNHKLRQLEIERRTGSTEAVAHTPS